MNRVYSSLKCLQSLGVLTFPRTQLRLLCVYSSCCWTHTIKVAYIVSFRIPKYYYFTCQDKRRTNIYLIIKCVMKCFLQTSSISFSLLCSLVGLCFEACLSFPEPHFKPLWCNFCPFGLFLHTSAMQAGCNDWLLSALANFFTTGIIQTTVFCINNCYTGSSSLCNCIK